MEGYNAETIKSWITAEGLIYGINIAYLMNIDHIVFHDRLYKYYHDFSGNRGQNEPLMYWRDSSTGCMVNMNGEFPHCMEVAIKNCGAPTYGIGVKHLDDLCCVFPDKREIVSMVKQAFKLSKQ